MSEPNSGETSEAVQTEQQNAEAAESNSTNGTAVKAENEIAIPDSLKELLEDISGDNPAGSDVSNDEEFFKLTMEVPKTIPDYKTWIELSENILRDKSKDIKVASWLCFAYYRTEKITGLKKGLILILHFLRKYGNDLFPSNPLHKSKAVQFINTGRVIKLLEKEEITYSIAKDVKESGQLINEIIDECDKLFTDNKPSLDALLIAINAHVEEAEKLLKPPEIKKPAAVPSAGKAAGSPGQKAAPQELVLSSEKDAVEQLRKIITFFFEYDEEGVKKQRIPENYFVFGVSRQIQWTNLKRPVDNAGVTLVEAPNNIIQGLIKEWFGSGNYDTLIARLEGEFIKDDSPFRFWFDAQKYLIESLEKKGNNYSVAIADIKLQLAKLLNRIPDLPGLKFSDKQTPFAGPETIKWLNEDVKSVLNSGGSGGANILPPILGEEYEPINKEYETVSNDIPENFEKNLLTMQAGINGEERRKGKFLRRLNLANYCFKLKEYELARVNLLELKDIIGEYNLAGWEPGLCTAVWQSLYLTNREISENENSDELKANLEKEQNELFKEIAKYDGVLAIKLNKLKQKER